MVERRLAAIMAADIAGFSLMMGRDEEGTLSAVKTLRRALFSPKVEQHRGHIFKNTGDGFLAEFASVVDAVRCAIDIQAAMVRPNGLNDGRQPLKLRIGVNLGDVIVDEQDFFGDGVNIAARLEGIAEPNSVIISGDAYDHVKGKLVLQVSDMGEQSLKNIEHPVRVYKIELDKERDPPALSLPDKPSIAVLPFTNMSGDAEQEYFADGMAEEILTALSRCQWLFVIARNSSFTYRGKAVDIRQVGRELGVRYVLEGSVRRSGQRIRFTAQLIEATSGSHIWADRFDGDLTDIFDLQDRITASVVAAIEPNLRRAEIERLKVKSTDSLDAYDLLLRAQQLEHEFTDE